ncbi:hypothetical protein ACTZWT_15640 [Rhodopseudomonas sp. NSM]|uniref:hypothetical protein n=1 Tax=Rhodopseudomonas sp. NSM TaxID=3457630 RepID=UPI004036DC08
MTVRSLNVIAGIGAFAIAVLISPFAFAESASSCGATAKEAIAKAEKALASKEASAQTQALACLLHAVKQLDAVMPIVRNADGQEALRVPPYKANKADGVKE